MAAPARLLTPQPIAKPPLSAPRPLYPTRIMDMPFIDDVCRQVYVVIRHLSGLDSSSEWITKSYQELSEQCGLSRRSVQYAIDKLEKVHLVKVIRRPRRKNSYWAIRE